MAVCSSHTAHEPHPHTQPRAHLGPRCAACTRTRGTSEAQKDRGTPSSPSPWGGHVTKQRARGEQGRHGGRGETWGPLLSSWRRQAWGWRRPRWGSRLCRASVSKRTQSGLPGEDQPAGHTAQAEG